jgi:nucleotide-binding universal stress UspA family protein
MAHAGSQPRFTHMKLIVGFDAVAGSTVRSVASPTSAAPILVGFDGSEGGRDALELARVLSSIRGTPCIVAGGLIYGPVSVNRALSDPEGAEVEPLFDQARAALEDTEVETRVIGSRSPARMLVECAEREHAGTIVVGSPHLGRVGRALLGSVAQQVLHHAPCEVVVAPAGYSGRHHDGYAKIAVAFDGTRESKVALRRAEDLARQADATIEILVASDPVVAGVEAEFPPDAPSSISDVLEAAVGSVDPALFPTGRKVDSGWRQVARRIAAALADACGPDVDLLVAGSHHPLDRFLLGSVTRHLVTEAPCPVLVVPDPE